jgi:hypothetical protein
MHTIFVIGASLVFSGAAPGSGDPESATHASTEEAAWAATLEQGQKARGEGQGSEAKPSDPRKSPAARGGAAREQDSRSRAQQGPERSRRNERSEARGQRASERPEARSERRPVPGRPDQARERREGRERAGERSRTGERERARDRGDNVEPRARRPELDRSDERRPRRGGRVGHARLQQGLSALPPETRRLATSSRRGERLVAGAVAHAVVRGLAPSSLVVRSSDDRVAVLNRKNELLLDLDPRSARELGSWEVRRLGDQRPHAGSPAFCASGTGHPVWGREWCIDKGFGLGGGSVLWSRGTVDDVIFRRRGDRDRVDGGSLEEVLGEIVFNRLALHALALGYDEPIKGLWVAEPTGPRLLRVYSGEVPVAELMDADRDDRVEIIYVAQHR